MIPGIDWVRLAIKAGIGLVIIGLFLACYLFGSSAGSKKTQSKWDQAELVRSKAIAKQQIKNGVLEQNHATQDVKTNDQLAELKEKFASDIAGLNARHNAELLRSNSRAEVYQRQSQGSTTEQASVASYAARFDQSIVEGQDVVRELLSTLELRDGQLKALGAQILNDRTLILDDSNGNEAVSAK